jgi:hypothetical protein
MRARRRNALNPRRRNAVGAQDLPDGRGGHPVPEPTQLALDPDHAPPVFSRARRRISATSSSSTGGRPGGLGWRHFTATRRRCERSSVPGVTIRRARSPFGMVLVSAASTARSVQDMRGLGFARRSTAASCRSASISTSLDDEDRATSASQDSTVTRSRASQRDTRGCRSCRCRSPRSNPAAEYSATTGHPYQSRGVQRRVDAEFQTSASVGGVARPCSGLRTGTSPRYSTRSPSLI